MEKLVNWDGKKFKWYDSTTKLGDVVSVIESPRPKEVVRFVDALSAYYGSIGMHKICKACFAGDPAVTKFTEHECCGGCALRGETKCLSKPMGCAMWMCSYTQSLFPKSHKLLEAMRERYYAAGFQFTAWLEGRKREPKKLNHRQKFVLGCMSRVLEREIENAST